MALNPTARSGAISAATGAWTSPTYNPVAPQEARFYLKAAIGPTCLNLASWNDRPGRTHAEVLEAFDSAIGGLGS